MPIEDRIPEELFNKDGHYLGRPADISDKIIQRRVNLLLGIKEFVSIEKNLLEIGCGNGATMQLLSSKLKHCDGIEITNEHQSAFNKLMESTNTLNCSYAIKDIDYETPSKIYDRVISFEVIEHLKNENLSFYYNSLKSDGLMAITVPNKWWIFETHGANLPLLPWNRIPFFSWLPKFLHERWANARIYTKSRIIGLLESNNFEIVEATYVTAPMDVLPNGMFKDFAIKLFFSKDSTKNPFKAISHFIVVKKK